MTPALPMELTMFFALTIGEVSIKNNMSNVNSTDRGEILRLDKSADQIEMVTFGFHLPMI